MATSSLLPNEEKRRFVALTVDEVSLVDSPANEEEFVVIKRQQEDEMPDEVKKEVEKAKTEEKEVEAKTEKGKESEEKKVEDEEEKKTKKSKEDEPEKVETETEKGTEEISKKLDRIASLVEDITKSSGEEEPEKKEGEEVEEETEKKKKEAKAEDDEEEDVVAKSLEGIVASIQKAKRFTPKREAALKQVVEQLNGLLTELAPTPAKEESKPSGTSLGDSGIDSVTKSIEALSAKVDALAGLVDTTKSLNERVESIEKAKQPSKSIDDGDTTKEETTEKSMWSNVL